MFSPEVLWAIGIVAVGGVLLVAMLRYSRRDRSEQPRREAATRALYDQAGHEQPRDKQAGHPSP